MKPVSSTPVRSAPAQKWPPAPVSTTTRAALAARVRLEQLLERLVVEGVAPLGPVDREQCDVAPVLQVDHAAEASQ